MTENKKVVSPSEYRKKVFVEKEVETPNGFTFKIRRLSPIDIIESGLEDLPNPFLEFIQNNNQENFQKVLQDEKSRDTFEKFLTIVIEKGMLEPKVKVRYEKEEDNKERDFLYWSEIDEKDQAVLLNSILGAELKNV